jgi:DNA-binding NarL/FixJ family response regulator
VSIKILLAYDNNNMLTEMRKFLAQERSIEIVREARDFSTAIQLAVHAKADILLIDLYLHSCAGQLFSALPLGAFFD